MDAYLPKRFALTGASGALGFAFLRRNFGRDSKLQATLLVRRSSSSFQAEEFQKWLRQNRERVTLIDGDVRRLGTEETEALLACDGGLWHFAAVTSLAEGEEIMREIRAVNVEATERLAEACRQSRSNVPFYHVSTAYVAGTRHGTVLEMEDTPPPSFRNPYEAAKLEAETGVRRAFAAGVKGAIFRPSVVVDDFGGTGGIKMVDACAYAVGLAVTRNEPFVFRLKPSASLNLVHSDWVIAAMIDLARLPSGPGRVYHLTAPKATCLSEIASILHSLVPGLRISFEPELKRAELPTASKIFDKAVTDLRSYLEADIHFDRQNTLRDLSAAVKESPMDLAPFVKNRLKSELARLAHRKQL
ncbi:MAG TPA: SDR family oxidoreductase [Candidatus Methylacidiphilales bacterium]|nr:SDR family oxidoreductase [Candidatus Methylacidiphilales bacterium]